MSYVQLQKRTARFEHASQVQHLYSGYSNQQELYCVFHSIMSPINKNYIVISPIHRNCIDKQNSVQRKNNILMKIDEQDKERLSLSRQSLLQA